MSFLMNGGTPYVALRFKKKPWFRRLYQQLAVAAPVLFPFLAPSLGLSAFGASAGMNLGTGLTASGMGYGAYAGKENQEDIIRQQEEYQSQQAAAAEAANTMNNQRELSGVAASPAYLRSNLPTQAVTPQYTLPYPDVPLQYPQPGYSSPYTKAGDMFRNIFRRQY